MPIKFTLTANSLHSLMATSLAWLIDCDTIPIDPFRRAGKGLKEAELAGDLVS